MVLNLDPSFNPFSEKESVPFEAFMFSGGEPHIRIACKPASIHELTITHRICSFNDFGLLLLAIDAGKRAGIKNINVFIPYFPAARQDRVMVSGEPLSVKVYAELLNQMKLQEVMVFDPHSEVTPAVLDHCRVVSNHNFIKKVSTRLPSSFKLVSPDGGALKKIYKVAEYLGGMEVIECSKSRDVKTGSLTGFQVYTDDIQGSACLLVDDICDGGGTFIGLAQELKKKNAGDLYLAVSHGIFSKGMDALATHYKTIFTTNSFKDLAHHAQLVQLPLNSEML